MPSSIPEFEYDIFISYRHNDNKYEKWVTTFVTKLQQELLATCKGKINIYFDENPHNGLMDTHNVDRSLEKKLNTAIFIPIISQTYCDTSSFAWKNEFMLFKEIALKSPFGLEINLPNGNVASRILPVKIHEIESSDIRLLEQELSGYLRSIDFIYQSQGVNRPLRPEDDILGNINKTIYRNQINKVANAVKELIGGFKNLTNLSKSIATSNVLLGNSAFSASVPANISFQLINSDKKTVYLAWTSSDLKSKREEMALILDKAGFNVVPGFDCPADEEDFKQKSKELIKMSDCSLHLMSGQFGRRFEIDFKKSFPQFQLEAAMELSDSENEDNHTFVWYTPDESKAIQPDQNELIKVVRNNITRRMTFSNSLGPMPLVDDMRSIMKKKEEVVMDTTDTDIFFIFNQQDEFEAQSITDNISMELPVEIMNIMPNGEDEYKMISTQQIPKSKLTVVYFKYAADWAIPFIKQVWKSVGGASSPTPMLLVGEDKPETNRARTFKAPKVVTTITSKDDVTNEIKKVFSHVINLD
jgi:hypothetical protein